MPVVVNMKNVFFNFYFVRSLSFLCLEFFLYCIVYIFDEDGVSREHLSILVKLLSLFVCFFFVDWGCLSILHPLMVLWCSLDDAFSYVLALSVVAEFAIRVKIRPSKYFKLLFGEFTNQFFIFSLTVFSVFIGSTWSTLITIAFVARCRLLIPLVRISFESKSLTHSYSALSLLHLLNFLLIGFVWCIWVVGLALHNHRSIIVNHYLLSTHHLVVNCWAR